MSTAAHTANFFARFLWGLAREICQKVDVVWFEKLQSLWWSSQLGDNNVHPEATAVDFGGKLTSGKPYWCDFGATFGHFVGDVEAKSGYGIGHVEAICQILFGHVVGFVSQSALPQKHQDFKGVLASYVLSSGGYSYASWGKVGGSWGQVGLSGGRVQAKLGYVMFCWRSDFLRPCCWFCTPKCFPPSRTKILSGFLRAMFAPFGVKQGLRRMNYAASSQR